MTARRAPTLDEQARSGRYSPETRQAFDAYDEGRDDGSMIGMVLLLSLYGLFMWMFGFAMRPALGALWDWMVS